MFLARNAPPHNYGFASRKDFIDSINNRVPLLITLLAMLAVFGVPIAGVALAFNGQGLLASYMFSWGGLVVAWFLMLLIALHLYGIYRRSPRSWQRLGRIIGHHLRRTLKRKRFWVYAFLFVVTAIPYVTFEWIFVWGEKRKYRFANWYHHRIDTWADRLSGHQPS